MLSCFLSEDWLHESVIPGLNRILTPSVELVSISEREV